MLSPHQYYDYFISLLNDATRIQLDRSEKQVSDSLVLVEGVVVARVALAHGRVHRKDGLDLLQVRGGELHLQRGVVLVEVRGLGGAGDGDHVGSLGVQPGQGELTHSDALAVRDGLHGVDEVDVVLKVGTSKLGGVLAPVSDLIGVLDGTSKEAATQRRVSDDLDACKMRIKRQIKLVHMLREGR